MVFSVGDLHVGTPTKSESDIIHEAIVKSSFKLAKELEET